MPTEWYFARDGERSGPVGFDELKRRSSTGLLRADDLVWGEGEPDWEPAGRIAGLFPRIETEWYYSRKGERLGPVSEDALKRLAVTGRLQESDLVWAEGELDWEPVSRIVGLFPRIATEWYYSQAGERFGPVSDEVLERLAVTGRLQEFDLVWCEGELDWKPALHIPILFKVFQPDDGAIQPKGMIRRAKEVAALEEMGAISERRRQAVSVGGVGDGPVGEPGSVAHDPPGLTVLAEFRSRPIRSLALLLQAPLVSVAICAAFGGDLPAKPGASSGLASVLFWMGLAALWFGLSNALIVDILGAARAQGRPRDVALLLGRLGVMGVLVVIQCMVAWVIVSNLTGLRGPWLASLALLILASAVGLALGCLVVAMAPHSHEAWAASGLIMVLLWLFGGGPQSFPREASWAMLTSNAVPSRWAFEGLLLLRADRPTLPETARQPDQHWSWDIAEGYFPADTERMGTRADVMALVSMLIGLSATSAFLAWDSEERGCWKVGRGWSS